MYDFTDTTEAAGGNTLPAEAVSINGEYIEDYISGYRTLYTSGRESLEKEFESYDDTAANGSLTKFTRFPARTITVGFQLLTNSPEEFREAFNGLNQMLNVEDAEIIFNDEQDKFFTGSPVMNAEIEPGLASVKGEYQIYCADPFKYSVDYQNPQPVMTEDADTGLAQTFLIDYAGTYPAYPQYVAKFYNPDGETDEDNVDFEQTDMISQLGGVGACKFVAFMDIENHVLQFGDPEIEDGSEVPGPLVLTDRSFKKKGSYDASKNGEPWVSPSAGFSKLSQYVQQGSLGNKASTYAPSQNTKDKDQVLLSLTSGTDCKYKATVTKVNGRTSTKVTLHIQVKLSSLKAAISKGATLTIEVTYGSKTVTKVLKSSGVSWKKGTAHSASLSMSVDASQSKTELTGIKIKVTRKNGTYKVKQNGSTKTKTATGSAGKLSSKTGKPIEIPAYVPISDTAYFASPTSYGNAVKKKYTGPTMTWSYPLSGLPETDDSPGAKLFDLTWGMKFCMGKTTNEVLQMGAFECLILGGISMDSSGTIAGQEVLAGISIRKTNTSSKGTVYLYVENKQVYKRENVDLTWSNGKFGNKNGSVSCGILAKTAGLKRHISFNIPGLPEQSKLYWANSGKRAFKIVFGFYRYAENPPFDFNGVRSVRFKKNYKEESELEDTPFQAAQILVADSSTCDVMLDDILRPDLGALGNDWEQMRLVPGINEITTAYSQRPADAVKVMRRCRDDEAYQGAGAYGTDDEGDSVQIDGSDEGVKTYYKYAGEAGTEPTKSVFFYESETTDDSGKKTVTASGVSFIETDTTADDYDAESTAYFVLEEPVPEFAIQYREVYL